MPDLLVRAAVFAALAALAALVAHLALAVYHDGLRGLMPEYRRGELAHRTIGRKAFDISIGFVLYYALPFTLATGVMVSHTIFLPADIIGLAAATRAKAFTLGAAYGALATLLLGGALSGLAALPVDFLPHLSLLVQPLGYLLGLMPVLAAAQQFGLGWGAGTLVLVLAVRVAASLAQVDRALPGFTADGGALAAGSLLIVGLALRRRGTPIPDEERLFTEQLRNLRRALPWLLAIGALAAIAASFHWLAGEPAATLLLGTGRAGDAAVVALFSAVGFMPMVVATSAVSGSHTTQGYPDWILGAGFLIPFGPVAAVAGVGLMALEIAALPRWMRLLGRFPELRELGAAIRDALTHVTEVALIVGGFLAANAIWEGYGIFVVGALYVLNEASGRHVMRLAVGPIGALLTGLAVNGRALLT